MKSPDPTNAAFKRLMSQLPSDTAATFTDVQKHALIHALQKTNQGQHSIDIRLSIPFPKPGFYVVLYAGQERRSVKRPHSRHLKHSPTAAYFLATILLLSGAIALGLTQLFPRFMSTVQNASFHPTAIPWLQTEAECVHTGRIWQGGKCWDKEHDANF